MGEEKNVDFIKRVYAALEEDDITDLLTNMCASDAEWVYPNVEMIPYCRVWRGTEEILRFFSIHDEEEEILDFRLREFVASGDRVAALGSFRGRAKSTGRVWDTDFVHVATINNGRLQRFESYFDTAAAVEARRT